MALYDPTKWSDLLVRLKTPSDTDISQITGFLRDAHTLNGLRSGGSRVQNIRTGLEMTPAELDPATEKAYASAYDICKAVLANPSTPAEKSAACEMLMVSIEKRTARMRPALAHFGAATRAPLIAPSPERNKLRAQGLAGTQQDLARLRANQTPVTQTFTHLQLRHRKYDENGRLTGSGNYWLEKADPLHRAWGHEGIALYEHWANDFSIDIDFFTWAHQNRDALAVQFPACKELLFEDRGVRYLSPAEKFMYRVKVQNNKLLRRSRDEVRALKVSLRLDMAAIKAAAQFSNFSTAGYETLYNGPGFAIWVCGPSGKIYSHRHKKDVFHHSSFFAGEEVLCGGEWAVSNGELVMVCDKTGHYGATQADFHRFCKLLEAQGLDLKDVVYQTSTYANGVDADRNYYWLYDWVRNYPNITPATTPELELSTPFAPEKYATQAFWKFHAANPGATQAVLDAEWLRLVDLHAERQRPLACQMVANGTSPKGRYDAWHKANKPQTRPRGMAFTTGKPAPLPAPKPTTVWAAASLPTAKKGTVWVQGKAPPRPVI